MLDALYQMTMSPNAADSLSGVSAPVAPPEGQAGFGQVMDEAGSSTSVGSVPPKSEDEPLEFAPGWDAAKEGDTDDYGDPALTAAAGESSEPAEAPVAENAGSAGTETVESEAVGAELAAEEVAADPAKATAAALLEELRMQGASTREAATSVGADAAVAEAVAEAVADGEAALEVASTGRPVVEGDASDATGEKTPIGIQTAASVESPEPKADGDANSQSKDQPEAQPASPMADRVTEAQAVAVVAVAEVAESTETPAETAGDETAGASRAVAATVATAVTDGVDVAAGTMGGVSSVAAVGGADSPMAMTLTPSASGAETASTADAAADLPEANVDQLASRTVRWRNLGVLGRGGVARIRLDPPSLGSVEVMLRTSGTTVHVELTVETEAVRQLLQSSADRLAQSLGAHGMRAERITVNVSTPGDATADGDSSGDDREPSDGRRETDDEPDRDQRRGGSFADDMEPELNLTA